MQVYIVDNTYFSIEKRLIPVDSFLYIVCKSEWTDETEVNIDVSRDEFVAVHEYLVNGRIINDIAIEMLDRFNIAVNIHGYPDEYWRIKLEEDYYRTHRNENYKLIDFETVAHLIASDICIDSHTLKQRTKLLQDVIINRSVDQISSKINNVTNEGRFYDKQPNIIFAGGVVLSCIFGTTVHDIDIFVYGLDKDDMCKRVNQMFYDCYVYVGSNSVNFCKIQVILRAYDNIEQILTGFDLDASGICFVPSTGKIYLTERCLYALKTMTNYVDFDRFSTTYEYRLTKYMRKYFNIWIPHFNIANVNYDLLLDVVNKYHGHHIMNSDDGIVIFDCKKEPSYRRYRHKKHSNELCRIRGIDSLLYRYMRLSLNKTIVHMRSDYVASGSEAIHMLDHDITPLIVTLNPHEQINGSFHRVVINDYREWYKGSFYSEDK